MPFESTNKFKNTNKVEFQNVFSPIIAVSAQVVFPFLSSFAARPFYSTVGILVQTFSKANPSGSTAFYPELTAREHGQE